VNVIDGCVFEEAKQARISSESSVVMEFAIDQSRHRHLMVPSLFNSKPRRAAPHYTAPSSTHNPETDNAHQSTMHASKRSRFVSQPRVPPLKHHGTS
jgi:hypothetical protein